MCDNCKFVDPTPEEDKKGYVSSTKNPYWSMPTESTLGNIMEELNDLSAAHKLEKCDDYQSCELCFAVSNLTHNSAFIAAVGQTMRSIMGPASMFVPPADMISIAGLFMLLGMRSQNFITQTQELNKISDISADQVG